MIIEMAGNNFVITIREYLGEGFLGSQDGGMISHLHREIPKGGVASGIGRRNSNSRIIPSRVRLPCQTNETVRFLSFPSRARVSMPRGKAEQAEERFLSKLHDRDPASPRR